MYERVNVLKKLLILVLCLAMSMFVGCNKKVKQVDVTNYPDELKDYTSATLYNTQYYCPTMFFSEPDINSNLIFDKTHSLMVLEEKDGWLYGCCGDRLGWIEAKDMEKDEYSYYTIPLPEFLTKEHKLKYLRAYCMYSAYINGNEFGIGLNYGKSDRKGYCLESAFKSYDEFEKSFESLFTTEFINSNDKYFRKHNGRVYVPNGGSGMYFFETEGYTLTKKSDDRIEFNVNFLYKTPIADHRCSIPIVMVKTEDGWKYDSFINGYDDVHISDEMGEDFNPNERYEN